MSGVRVWTRELMGTVFSVHVVGDASGGPEQRAAEDLAAARFFDEVSGIERIFSTFRDDSEVSRIRRGELDFASADPRVGTVAAACDEAETATAGRFSVHWRGGFDPTGYVKGWSVDIAGAGHLEPLLREPGIRALGVNAGGDVRVWSRPETPWTWRVGVADPARRGAIVATIELTSGAVATSGTAERGTHHRAGERPSCGWSPQCDRRRRRPGDRRRLGERGGRRGRGGSVVDQGSAGRVGADRLVRRWRPALRERRRALHRAGRVRTAIPAVSRVEASEGTSCPRARCALR